MATAKNVSTVSATGWFRQRNTNATGVDTAIVDGETSTDPTADTLISMTMPNGRRYRGAVIMPFGTDAQDEVFTLDIQHVGLAEASAHPGRAPLTVNTNKLWIVNTITVATCTLAAATFVGVDGTIVDDSDFWCDTVAISSLPFRTSLENVTGSALVTFSPGSDTGPARVWIPDMMDADYLRIELSALTSAASANCLVKLTS